MRGVGAFFLFVLCVFAEERFVLLSPGDQTIYREGSASVTVKILDPAITKLLIKTDTDRHFTLSPKTGRDSYCQSVPLHLGNNKLTLTAYAGDVDVGERSVRLYHLTPADKSYKYPPQNFQELGFHTEKKEKGCIPCHTMESNERKGYAFSDVHESNCYGCHKNLTTAKYAHAPAVNFLCTACHDRKFSSQTQLRYPRPDKSDVGCFVCHTKNEAEWKSRRFLHAPLEMGHCERCHNPHATDNLAFLRLPVNALCITCHGDKRLPAAQRGASPCPGNEAPSCVACHNPHAANRPFFLKESPESGKR